MSQDTSITLARILVATDLEKTSVEALRVADEWARSSGAALGVISVLPSSTPITDEAKRAVEAQVLGATGRTASQVTVFFDEGVPAEAIVARASEWGASLVVVGTHGTSGLERWLIGSVAQLVVRNAHCPVIVARPSPDKGAVLAACEVDELTAEVVRWAKATALSPLVLLHTQKLHVSDAALMASAIFSGTVAATPSKETVAAIGEMTLRSLEAELDKVGAAGQVEMIEGSPAATIVLRGKELGASLIVVGSHKRRGLSRLALGSVSEAVARDALSSVLIVR